MFQTIRDLPSLIRRTLSNDAQEVYRAAYNRTWQRLAAGADDNRQAMTVKSHKAARLAVQNEFTQDAEGDWRHDPVGKRSKRQGQVGNPAETG